MEDLIGKELIYVNCIEETFNAVVTKCDLTTGLCIADINDPSDPLLSYDGLADVAENMKDSNIKIFNLVVEGIKNGKVDFGEIMQEVLSKEEYAAFMIHTLIDNLHGAI